MAILAGIDEAGFGPLLGPLVVSSCAFSITPDLADQDLWPLLRKSVGKTRSGLRGRLLVTDSKKAYKRAEGLGHLERTVLAALGILGERPADLATLLNVLCPDCAPRVWDYPWYAASRGTAIPAAKADTRIAAKVFAEDTARVGANLMGLTCHCLDVGYYNAMVERMKNKSQVLFVTTTQLIQKLLDRFEGQDLHILIDRQGGRVHYREHLLRSFAGMELRIVQETEQCSAYELRGRSRQVCISFSVGADGRHLPVALASMVSKYVRELLVESMNRHFVGLSPDLKPTAGYWQDGLRFLKDLRERLPEVPLDRHRLVRCR